MATGSHAQACQTVRNQQGTQKTQKTQNQDDGKIEKGIGDIHQGLD